MRRRCANGTPTAPILATTRPAAPRAANSATTISIPSPSPALNCAATTGRQTLRAMLLLDEIRGRLAEVFALKDYKIDHVVHGAIASAATYGALLARHGRPNRVGDRAGRGPLYSLSGDPRRQAAFRLERRTPPRSAPRWPSPACIGRCADLSARPIFFATPRRSSACSSRRLPKATSPFDLTLATSGDDFAVLGMHFKLGLYEHQSAGAIQGLIDLLARHPAAARRCRSLGADPHLRSISRHSESSATRPSAIRARGNRPIIRWSISLLRCCARRSTFGRTAGGMARLMLVPADYDDARLARSPHPATDGSHRVFVTAGRSMTQNIPTAFRPRWRSSIARSARSPAAWSCIPKGMRETSGNLSRCWKHKFRRLAGQGVAHVDDLYRRFTGFEAKTAAQIAQLYDFPILGLPDPPQE